MNVIQACAYHKNVFTSWMVDEDVEMIPPVALRDIQKLKERV